ncbi:MAG: hypothetical protein MUF10_00480 [Thermoanaerobaculaceae bacterium]|jgi:hypothetical protein|nr:hypothetical protein [Thermoanaerobaculaceae bacterium]
MSWNDANLKPPTPGLGPDQPRPAPAPPPAASRRADPSTGYPVGPRWDDGLEHCWSLSQPHRSVGWALVMLITFAAIPVLVLAALWLLSLASNLVAVILGAVLTAFFLLRYLAEVVRALRGHRVSVVARAMASNRFLLATCALGGWAFLMAADAPGLGRAFTSGAALPPILDWSRFWAGEIADMALFDIPEALGWSGSPLAPRSRLAIAALGGFRLLFGLGVVELAARVWQRFVTGATFYATMPDAWGRCAADLDPQAEITWLGRVAPEPAVLACEVGDFVATFRKQAEGGGGAPLALDEREEA